MSRKKIGSIGVDGGMCWIGDPCYVLPDDASQRLNLWNKLLKAMENKLYTSMNYITKNISNKYAEGLGVCVTTGYGDGEYPVYAEIEDNTIKSVTIVFVK
jgi:hypothetical protein|tara:strand:+ start:197 stop:496 length:300 start_codon:yes stop_codon:yes gene_type:complete